MFRRFVSAGREWPGVAELAFQRHLPPASSSTATSQLNDRAVLVVHGMFGTIATKLERPVYAVDLRDHGESPWTPPPPHRFGSNVDESQQESFYSKLIPEQMAKDLRHFMRTHLSPYRSISVIGHSLGARLTMEIALTDADSRLDSIIPVDMAPNYRTLPPSTLQRFLNYISVMREIERCRPTKKSQADEMLAAVEPDLMVRQFLLTNLVHGSGMHETARRYHEHYHAISTTNSLAFRVNLAAIQRTLLAMQKRATGTWDDGDVMPGQFDKPTLFIYGTRGDYVKEDRDGEEILRLFPKARLVGLPTGHWVHSENPMLFLETVLPFLQRYE